MNEKKLYIVSYGNVVDGDLVDIDDSWHETLESAFDEFVDVVQNQDCNHVILREVIDICVNPNFVKC